MNTGIRILLLGWLCLCSIEAFAQVVIVPLPARQLVYDPQAKLLYASIGPKGQDLANSIVAIDCNSGRVVRSAPTATEPGPFTLSNKGRFLYVAVGNSKQVRRLELPALTAGLTYPIIEGSTVGSLLAGDTPESVVMVKQGNGPSASIVYDNEKPRRLGHAPLSKLFTGLHPLLLYGTENGSDLSGMFLTDRGTALRLSATGLPGGGLQACANGLLYFGDGSVVDPETQQVVGKFPEFSGVLCADPESGSTYSLDGEKSDFKLSIYDNTTYRKVNTITLVRIGASERAGELVVCGTDSLAFRAGDRIVILKGVRRPRIAATDLEVTRSELPNRLPRDGRWSYILTVKNKSSVRASGVFLTDKLEGENLVGEVKASQGSTLFSSGSIRADLGAIPPGASLTITVNLATRDLSAFGATALVRSSEPEANVNDNLNRLETAQGLLPDLTPQFRAIQQISQGSGINLETYLGANVVVRNVGGGDSPPCIARFYVSDGPNFIVQLATLLQDVAVPAIKAGDAVPIQLRAPLGNGGDLTGSFLHVVIDPTDRVKEEVKSNNVAGGRIR